ncbi:glycolate oxidase subunit GlcF [Phenylobacterium sp.]|jgi:glycolate oxidase iron-sulfur subunit|uniref:glycolate oxidase subunit GlcF n=1 Tax=Phenylobacterium sp. TaxID=1871053 RepID=UPI002F92E832
MRVDFPPERLADPEFARSHTAIRKCVHCGFCTATCPTYVLLGDERDSPRGRIELIRAMLETPEARPAASTVKHIDRCLSCLACKTTCPSGVDYADLIDHARRHIEDSYRRPWPERLLRALIPAVLTRPKRLRAALALGRLARPVGPALQRLGLAPLAALLRLVPERPAAPAAEALAAGTRGRVALLQGCVEPAMAPEIRAAAARLLSRAGFEVVEVRGEGCCGALSEHLGRAGEAAAMARRNIRAWQAAGPLDAVITTAAGCGTTLKAYGKQAGAEGAEVGAKARDILEFIAEAGLPPVSRPGKLAVAYHAPCSLQHGQGIKAAPAALLAQAGFEVREPFEPHLCCGSAGVYNILQPELAGRLRDRKAENLRRTGAAVVAAGNVGCIAQIAPALDTPVVHPVELLDWATGGPEPAALRRSP